MSASIFHAVFRKQTLKRPTSYHRFRAPPQERQTGKEYFPGSQEYLPWRPGKSFARQGKQDAKCQCPLRVHLLQDGYGKEVMPAWVGTIELV